ncbi:MAG: ABC transporter permease [Candidatus Sumerlaeia bacterium]
MLFQQARYKWSVTLLLFLAMTSLVALFVYLRNTDRFANRSMQIIMKNIGHNMLILPKAADPVDVYLVSDGQMLFSDDVTHEIGSHKKLASKYYVSILQQRIGIEGHDLVLTGIEPVKGGGESGEKANMIKALPPATARIGSGAAKRLGKKEDDSLRVEGREFTISEVVRPRGTLDDYRLFVPLDEAQQILEHPGQINVVWAFMCLKGKTLAGVEKYQTALFEELMPDYFHISQMDIAAARFLARDTTQQSLYYLLGIVFVITVLIIAITGIQEVNERRREVGILVAMGTRYSYVVALYAVKMLLLALVSGLVGFLIGSRLAVGITSSFLVVNTQQVQILWDHLPRVLGLTVLVMCISMIVPVIRLLVIDPNNTLSEE